jgi:CHAT domain-containing protein
MRHAIAAVLLFALSAHADEPLVTKFAALLAGDDAGAIRELTPPGTDVENDWRSFRDVLDRYDCISVESATGEWIGDGLLRVIVRATGTTPGGIKRTDPLPRVWFLTADAQQRVRTVESLEHRLAVAMLDAKTDAERRALLDPHADFDRLAMWLAWLSAEPERGEGGLVTARFAREIAEATGDHSRVAMARQMEATQYLILGRPHDALPLALETIENCAAVCDADVRSTAHFAAAGTYWSLEDLGMAIEHYHRATDDVDQMTDPRRAVRAYVNLAHLYQARGQFTRAAAAVDEMERLARRHAWLEGLLDAYLVQTTLHERLGNHAVSNDATRKAYELAVKLQDRKKIDMVRLNAAVDEMATGDAEAAIRSLRQILPDSDMFAVAQLRIGDAERRRGRIAEAVASYEATVAEATRAGEHGNTALALLSLSSIALRDDPARALELARQAGELLPKLGTHQSRANLSLSHVRTAEGAALRALGRNEEAEQALETAVAEIEKRRGEAQFVATTHADFLTPHIDAYHHLLELRLVRGRVDDAVRLSERLKGALLDEIRSAGRGNLDALLTDEQRDQQAKIDAELVRLNRELFVARRDPERAERVKAALKETRSRWELLETTLRARHRVQQPKEVIDPLQSPQLLLPSGDDVILDYVVSPAHTTLFVLTRGERLHIDTHRIDIGEAELNRRVERFLGRLGSRNFDYRGDARELYRLLVEPAAKALANRKTVAIAGDGPLWRLPFQALEDSDGKPLVARFTLFYAPSLTSLLRVPEPPSKRTVLAIGNPQFSDDVAATLRSRTRAELGDLPDAAVEARQIAALYGRSSSRLLTGREATERAMKEQAAQFDVLHIAAHAIADDDRPLYSGIVLARDSAAEDGLLEGREITRLDLRARLAVLSACSTAQGSVRPGEGLIGLSWAFLVAGCPTIVATQWRVPSESTARLMIEFHRELARGGTSSAVALRRAQMKVMKDPQYRHPFYWSAFVVVGAGRS